MTVDDWESFSNENILAAEKQRNNSQNLRSLIDGILQQVANDMEQQRKAVDVALQIRIDETRDSKCKLEDHLSKVKTPILPCDGVDKRQYRLVFPILMH